MNNDTPIRLLIVDDDVFVATMLLQVLREAPDIECVGTATNGQEAIELTEQLKPDLVLMDVVMPVLDGVEAARKILATPQAPRVLMWTTFEFDGPLRQALAAGASGFLLKSVTADSLIQSLRAAMHGVTVLGSEVTHLLTSGLPTTAQRPTLTERETDVLRMLCQGASNTQVAQSVYLSESTVKNTITALKDKLQAPSRAVLIAKALDFFPEMLADTGPQHPW